MTARRSIGPSMVLALLLAVLVHGLLLGGLTSSRTPRLTRPSEFVSREFQLEPPPPRVRPEAEKPPVPPVKSSAPEPPLKPPAVPPAEAPEAPEAPSPQPLSRRLLSQQIQDVSETLVKRRTATEPGLRIEHGSRLSQHSAVLVAYETAFQQKIEQVGTLNYPKRAEGDPPSGTLRLSVAIRRDGSLYATQILKSSGIPALDEGALRIIRLAAPFPPLPEALLESLDVLVLSRTLSFEAGARVEAR